MCTLSKTTKDHVAVPRGPSLAVAVDPDVALEVAGDVEQALAVWALVRFL